MDEGMRRSCDGEEGKGKGGSGVEGSFAPPGFPAQGEPRDGPKGDPRCSPAPSPSRQSCAGADGSERGIWQARGGGSVFVNAGLLLYIMYFPVYNKEGDYNNFTSAHSWPVLTLGICDALFLYKRPGLGLCFLLSDLLYIFFL